MKPDSWRAEGTAEDPAEEDGQLCVPLCTDSEGGDGEHHRQVSVQSHQYQGVDGDKSRGHDEELIDLAPEVTKWPGRGEGIVSSCEGNTDNYEQDVSNLQRENKLSQLLQ